MIALVIFLLAALVIVYHHAGYPLLLKLMTKNLNNKAPGFYKRHYKVTLQDNQLPDISLIMPAHNEAATIQDKIRNLAALDYPAEKLHIMLFCDGCTDNTALLAKEALQEPECHWLNVSIIEKQNNCGKVAILNEAISQAKSSIVALSDVSALLSADSLLIVAAHLSQQMTGVVCGSYHFYQSLSFGEQAYWQYQRQIKSRESALGATLGVHGAFYAFQRQLFEPVPTDTINDDFALPVQIVMKGYRCLYDQRIAALELEQATNEMDFQRRKRIAAGNVQQAVRHIGLLHPKFGKIAGNFFSGKFLRPFMPLFLSAALVTSVLLAYNALVFQTLLIVQLSVYLGTLFYLALGKQPDIKIFRVVFYLVSGHIAAGIGLVQYLSGHSKGRWKKITNSQEAV